MSFQDAANYVSRGVITSLSGAAKLPGMLLTSNAKTMVTQTPPINNALWKLAGSNLHFVRLAGVFGASAVAISAYGTHRKYVPFEEDPKVDPKTIFETANRVHFFHTLALLSSPLARRPAFTGMMLAIGTILFCFPCYYRAFTGDKKFNRLAPIGGSCLIVAWLSMIF